MNIRDATIKAWDEGLYIRKEDRTTAWTLYVGVGKVYRNKAERGIVDLDARDCMGDDWYLVNADGERV